jgi:hypothetical protein
MPKTAFAIVGVLAAVPCGPSSAMGQTVTAPSAVRVSENWGDSGPRLSLAQIRITISQDWPAAARNDRMESFVSILPVIRSCADIDAVANAFGGEVVRNDTLHARDIPLALLNDLNARPIGTAGMPVAEGADVSVLIRCR